MKDINSLFFNVPSNYLFKDEKRFNASSFSPKTINILNLMEKLRHKGVTIEKLDNLVEDIFYPPRFKRIYGGSGNSFLSSKEIFDFIPQGKKIKNVSKDYFINEGWILITRSGSVGRILLANGIITKSAISEHVIRLVPINKELIGYIYVYLLSNIGSSLLNRNIFGSVVDQIEPQHVLNIDIPRIPEIEGIINKKIAKAQKLKEEAQKDLIKAKSIFYDKLELPLIKKEDITYLGDEKDQLAQCFSINSKDLDKRLDASFHMPIAHEIVNVLKDAEKNNIGSLKKLSDLSDFFVPPRFKRAYVDDPTEGIPLLQGTHITQIKPQGLKYIWEFMENLNKYVIEKNWILVTCSGTIGRLSLVSDCWAGWAATNHLLRIIPNEKKINAGYLTIFLLSIYGQIQFQRLVYGGVVDEIGEAGEMIKEILILKPHNQALEDEIGSLVIKAYTLRDKANKLENESITLFEKKIEELMNS